MKIFEIVMLICFGLSWPISVYQSIKTKSTKGKSVFFIFAVIIGYVSGIIGKVVNGDVSYVLVLYCINLAVVTADLVIYYVNKKRESIA